METHKKILIALGAIFIIWATVMNIRDIREEDKTPKKPEMYIGPDGRLVTPPLSRPVPTNKNMNDCRSCKIHANK